MFIMLLNIMIYKEFLQWALMWSNIFNDNVLWLKTKKITSTCVYTRLSVFTDNIHITSPEIWLESEILGFSQLKYEETRELTLRLENSSQLPVRFLALFTCSFSIPTNISMLENLCPPAAMVQDVGVCVWLSVWAQWRSAQSNTVCFVSSSSFTF